MINCRGAFSVREVKAGEEICFIPTECMLSESICIRSPIGERLMGWVSENPDTFEKIASESKFPHADKIICMIVFMIEELFENGESSFWFPYLDSLPEQYSLPVCWSESDTDLLLKGTPLGFTILERKKWLNDIVGVIKEAGFFVSATYWNIETVTWAFASISSRAFPKSNAVASNTLDWITTTELCLYPILDMLNHKRNHKICWNMSENGVSFVAGENTCIGNEIFNNYGSKGNENLLANYGFVLEDNPENYFKLYLNIRNDDPEYDLKMRLLGDTKANSKMHMLFDDEHIPPELIRVTRLLVANPIEIQNIVTKRKEYTSKMSVRNEFTAISTLFTLVSEKLRIMMESSPQKDVCASSEACMSLIYRQGLIGILKKSLVNFQTYAKNLICTGVSLEVACRSIFFTLDCPMIEAEFLEAISAHMFDEDTLLILAAIKCGVILPVITCVVMESHLR